MIGYDVLCIGSATIDRFLTVEQSLKSIKLGDKILVKSMEIHSGGSATNSAAVLSKLGLKVKILTKLGFDDDAMFIQKEFKKYHIKNLCKQLSQKHTDFSTIISSTFDKDRIIYNHKGASSELSSDDFKQSDLKAKWIYIGSLIDKSFQTSKHIVEYVAKKKIPLLFNPSLPVAKKGKNFLKPILDFTSILVLNKLEAQALLNTKNNNGVYLARALQHLGPKTVIITNGENKMFALNENKVYSLIPPKVPVVHTAGAGDAFTAGFLAGLIKKYSFEDALKLGQTQASSIIQHIGTKNKILTEKEAKTLMSRCKVHVI